MKTVLSKVLMSIESGSRPKGGAIKGMGIPSLGAEHLDNYGSFDFSKIKYIPEHFFNNLKSGILEKEDILIVKDGATTGKTSFIDEKFPFDQASINEHVFRLKIDKNAADPKYVFYFLFSSHGNRQIMADFHGATVGGISKKFTSKVIFPLPPLSDQRRIAEILDHADTLRRKNREILEKYNQLEQSVFYEMFGDPVSNSMQLKMLSGDEYCISISVGVVVKPASFYVAQGVPALRSLNIKPNKVDLSNLVYFSEKTNLKELKKSVLRRDDVLIVRTGQPGTSAIVPDSLDGANCIDLIIARPKPHLVRPIYLSRFFNTEGGKRIVLGSQKGQIQKHFNVAEIKKAKIPIPSLEHQDKYISQIKAIEQQITLGDAALGKSEALFQSLLQRAFRGEL